jgi:hypothetical protein
LNLKGAVNLRQILELLAAGAGLLSFPLMEIKESSSRAMVVSLHYFVAVIVVVQSVQLQVQKAGPLERGEQLVLMAEQWVQEFPNLECWACPKEEEAEFQLVLVVEVVRLLESLMLAYLAMGECHQKLGAQVDQ